MSNVTPGVYDPGATADGFEEARVCRDLVAGVACKGIPGVTFVTTPDGVSLSDVIRWTNTNYQPGDFLVSLHLNSGGGSGVEAIFAETAAPKRRAQAAAMSSSTARVLGLIDRGAKSDVQSHRGKLGILRQTKPPALLLELAFIDSARDRRAITECPVGTVVPRGVTAIIAGIKALLNA